MARRGRWSEVWRRKGSSRSGQIQITPPPTPPPAFDNVVTNNGADNVVTNNGVDQVTTSN